MPGRFSNLEFEDDSRSRAQAEQLEIAKSQDAPDYLAKANEAYHCGEFEGALRFFTRCLQQDRRVIAAWMGQVQMLVQLGEYHEARLWSDKALELFHNNGELLAARAQACIRLKDIAGAYRCSDAALQVPGGSPWRWTVRGELLLATGKGRYEDCFDKALAEPAAEWFDRVVIARILEFHGRAAAAINYLKLALELEPGHAYTWLQLGNCQAALGLAGVARGSLEHALELQPAYTPARQALDALAGSPLAWLRGLWRRWRRK